MDGLKAKANSVIAMLCLVAFGLGLLALREYTRDYGSGWWSAAVAGLAEALVIAGVLGLTTVDSILKTRLVKEISSLSLQTIYGKDAPQRYTVALQNELGKIQAFSDTTWTVALDWHVKGEVLRVQLTQDANIENISPKEFQPTTPWLRASMAGQPDCEFEEYRLTIEPSGAGSRRTEPKRFTFTPLSNYSRRRPDRALELHVRDRDKAKLAVPAGGRLKVLLRGVTYQPALGGLPLGATTVRMGGTLELVGDALCDLEVRAFTATEPLAPDQGSENLTFITKFGFPGNSLRAHHNPGCSRGLNPPVSKSDRAM